MEPGNKLKLVAGFALATVLPASASTIFEEDFNSSNGGFTVENSTIIPTTPWAYSSGTGSWMADGSEGGDQGGVTSILVSPLINISASGETMLGFTHRFSFESGWDGGVLEISVDGGTPALLSMSAFTLNGYNFTNPEGTFTIPEYMDTDVFSGDSAGYSSNEFIVSTADLGILDAGSTVQIRWLALWDNFATGTVPNWEVSGVTLNQVPETSTGLIAMLSGIVSLAVRRRRQA